MLQIILRLIGAIIVLFGVVLVYDVLTWGVQNNIHIFTIMTLIALITKKLFGFGDQNEATSGFKILGVMLSVVGALIVFFCYK